MRVTVNPVLSMETGELLSHDGQYEYSGPVALAKGDAQKAQTMTNATTTANNANTLFGESQSMQDQILPYLSAEMLNPTGFGAPALGEMKTQAGQTASGAAGAAGQQMRLNAARTGNTASLPAGIAAVNRTAEQNESNADLGIDLANQQLKQQQQQAGEEGISGLGSEDLNASLNSIGLSNQSLSDWADINKSAGNLWSNVFEPLVGGAESGAATYFGDVNGGKGGGCWLAAAVYDGWDDPRTIMVRDWLFNKWARTFIGWIVTRVYLALGEKLAKQVAARPWLRRIAKRLLDIALREAEADAALTRALDRIRARKAAAREYLESIRGTSPRDASRTLVL